MLRSMTGFGAARSVADGLELRVEVRSVNHRHLQVKTRAAPELAGLEGELERRVRARLERGAVNVHLALALAEDARPAVLDAGAARRYQAELAELARALGLEGRPTLDTLLALPGVVRASEASPPGPELEQALLALVEQALDELIEARAREGAALELDLRKHAAELETLVARVGERMPEVVRGHQRELGRRLDELLEGRAPRVRPEDLAREVALLADRLDVSEELARLASHLVELGRLLDQGGAVGRHLDFLVQEVFREVNTIGSKCMDATVAHWVVDAKTHVERLREQLQNVE